MAALCACNETVLLTNGKTAAVAQFRSPDKLHSLEVPAIEVKDPNKNASKKTGKKQQKTSDERSVEENFILASAISRDGNYVALCDDRKYLHVYKLEEDRCSLQFSSLVARRCTAVRFTQDNTQVIVADKSGDAYSFDVQEQIRTSGQGQGRSGQGQGDAGQGLETKGSDPDAAKVSEGEGQIEESGGVEEDEDDEDKGCSGRTLVLGHLSMLLDMLLVDEDKLIVTCDRDEKIRISHYPDAYNIHSYCLGHTEFVISLAYDEENKILISASGDCTIRLWNLDGKELHQRQVLQDLPSSQMDTDKSGRDPKIEAETTQDTSDTSGPVDSQQKNGSRSSNRQASPNAIQKISYCPACKLLCLAMYSSPHILVYKLTVNPSTGSPTLQLLSTLNGEGNIASICIHKGILWVVRQSQEKLTLSACKIHLDGDNAQMAEIVPDSSTESKIIQTFTSQPQLLTVPPSSLDLFPFLWKSTFQEDFKFQCNIKRHGEDNGNEMKRKRRKQR